MVRLFHLSSMKGTPFGTDDLGFFETHGKAFFKKFEILRTNSSREADLFLTNRWPLGRKFGVKLRLRNLRNKPILVWTHEPRYCTLNCKKINRSVLYPDVHIMDVYTGDVFLDNFSFYGYSIKQPVKLRDEKECPGVGPKRISAFISCIDEKISRKCVIDGEDRDFTLLRQTVAMDGYNRGLVDIYGKGWPKGISRGDTKTGVDWVDWQSEKVKSLAEYDFNICLENTNYDYYCTEKLWDTIQGACLPIYFGKGNKIYDDFPSDSFIDLSAFKNPVEIWSYIESMDRDEYMIRINRCINVSNTFLQNDSFVDRFEKALKRTVDRIFEIVNN